MDRFRVHANSKIRALVQHLEERERETQAWRVLRDADELAAEAMEASAAARRFGDPFHDDTPYDGDDAGYDDIPF